MKYQIIAIGRPMPPPIRMLVETYEKRLIPLGGCTLVEVAEYRRNHKTTPELAMTQEAGKLREPLAGRPYIALESRGKSYSSENFAQLLGKYRDEGTREMIFLIGGPDGLHEEILRNAQWLLSLSPMTLPHMLARVFLLEQIYRAMTLLHHLPYHR